MIRVAHVNAHGATAEVTTREVVDARADMRLQLQVLAQQLP
jgi:hypothetical protein